MAIWRAFVRGVRVLLNRGAADRELADEVEDYLARAAESHAARGMSPEAARRAARVEVGNVMVVRDQVRSAGWEQVVGAVVTDLRYGARRLRGELGFTVVVAVTLALGIGASTAIFGAVNPVLFESLPYPQAGRIVAIWDRAIDGVRASVTFGTYRELVTRTQAFEAIAVMKPWRPTMTSATEPERFEGQRVSADYFRVLGVAPALGQDFEAADDRANGPNRAILSDALWRRRFAADPAIVGRSITLNDNLYTVVGVMPRTFENVLEPSAQIWALLQYDASLGSLEGREWGHHLRAAGRVRAGVDLDLAARDLDAIARGPVPQFVRPRWASLNAGFVVHPLQDDVTSAVRPALLAVLGAVLLLLAIACVNVANLLLARGAQRRGEIAMRAALGAGRRRLIQQMLVESLLLAALGGALGMIVANLGVRALVALSPSGLPRVEAIGVDANVFIFALTITTVIGLLVGLIPALQATRVDLHTGLQHSSTRTVRGHHVTRRALVVAEVALALMLLVSAGLLLRSLQRLFAVEPGFEASRLLTMQVQTAGHRFDDDRAIHQFFAHALDVVRQTPGVETAAFSSQLPLSGDFEDKWGVSFESSPNDSPQEDHSAFRYAVSPGFFEAAGIRMRRGRLLDAHDTATAPPAVVINESFARRKFPDRDPIGQRVHVGDRNRPWFTIVGVVADVKQTSLALGAADAAYTTIEQWYFPDNPLWLVVRAQGDAAALAPAIRRAVWSVDKDQPIVRIATMEELVAASAAERRFALILFEAFALVALVLAATGIYGVLSGSVTERTREIGVRCALGASRTRILALVVRQGLTLTGLGIAIGVTGAIIASSALITLLFGVSRLDPITYAGVIALLLGVSGIACWVPAWRAARVDPSITLRAE
jgi:putative ABC transport system permease protein